MSAFTTRLPYQQALDPYKRVRYIMGMVLGPDEFEQNLTYLMARDRLHQRTLHGYGTVCGLKVQRSQDSDPPAGVESPTEIEVTPGFAINPQGQTIRVPEMQCVTVNEWLQAHKSDVEKRLEEAPDEALNLYVVLRYAQCETDKTYVPGEPCRTFEETVAASRIADDCLLALTLDPPEQVEENVIRHFGHLMRRLRVTDAASDYATIEELTSLLDTLKDGWLESPMGSPVGSPLGSPIDSPILSDLPLYLRPTQAAGILEELYRYWVIDIRPCLMPAGANCAGGPPKETSVLLAQISFNVSDTTPYIVEGAITINEENRPILLQTRLLQEWILTGDGLSQHDQQTLITLSREIRDETNFLIIWIHHPLNLFLTGAPEDAIAVTGMTPGIAGYTVFSDVNVIEIELDGPLALGADGVKVTIDGTYFMDTDGRTLAAAVDEDSSYVDRMGDLFVAYLMPDMYWLNDLYDVQANPDGNGEMLAWDTSSMKWVASGDLVGDLDAVNHKIVGVSPGERKGDAVAFEQAIKVDDAAGGDLSDLYPNPQVAAMRGQPIAAGTTPVTGDVLTWIDSGDGFQWQPQAPVVGGGGTMVSGTRDGDVLIWDAARGAWVPGPSIAEKELTRIVALSWEHSRGSDLRISHNGANVLGVAFAVGKSHEGGSGQALTSTVNEQTFQAFLEMAAQVRGGDGVVVPARILGRVEAVKIEEMPGGLITRTTPFSTVPETAAAFLLRFDHRVQNLLEDYVGAIQIVIKGDLILDETGERAIDAEFVRASLPTGDRPTRIPRGIQGGRFESWLQWGLDPELKRLNELSTTEIDDLSLLDGIGRTTVNKLRDRLSEGAFVSMSDLNTWSSDNSITSNQIETILNSLRNN